jgi:hypothetical protein
MAAQLLKHTQPCSGIAALVHGIGQGCLWLRTSSVVGSTSPGWLVSVQAGDVVRPRPGVAVVVILEPSDSPRCAAEQGLVDGSDDLAVGAGLSIGGEGAVDSGSIDHGRLSCAREG